MVRLYVLWSSNRYVFGNFSKNKPHLGTWNWTYRQKAHESSFPTEMLSRFRIRIGNISPSATRWHFSLWKWRTTPKPPLPLGRRRPHVIHRPTTHTTQTAEKTVEALWHTCAVESPLDTMARPKFANRPHRWAECCLQACTCLIIYKSTSFHGPIPQTQPPASSLDPSALWCQTASGSDPPIFQNALDRPSERPTGALTYVRTDRPTDRPRESLTIIGRCAPRVTRPNNT